MQAARLSFICYHPKRCRDHQQRKHLIFMLITQRLFENETLLLDNLQSAHIICEKSIQMYF